MTNEAYARVKIDALLAAQGWNPQDTTAVRYEVVLPDGTRADYVLCDRHGRSLAVIEAKRYRVHPQEAVEQARGYAQQLGVPYVFLSNGEKVLFWDWQREAYPHEVKTVFRQDDLERRAASLKLRRDVLQVPIDRRIVRNGLVGNDHPGIEIADHDAVVPVAAGRQYAPVFDYPG